MCVVGPRAGLDSQDTLYPAKDNILTAAEENLRDIPDLKWQYIALERNYVINYPAANICWPNYEPRLRPWYKETASVIRKDVVIVLDISRSMSTVLDQARQAVKAVLHTLGPNDRIGLVAFDDKVSTPIDKDTSCYQTQLARTLSANIEAMEDFVDGLRVTVGKSVYSKAMHKAFQYFINSPTDGQRDKVILFVSDGQPTQTDTDNKILTTISEENNKLGNAVIIHTFGISVANNQAKQLMKDIANQILTNTSSLEVSKGEFYQVDDTEQLREIMATFYNRPYYTSASRSSATYTVPYHDGFGFGIVLTACLPIHRKQPGRKEFMGVACVDMLMRDLVGELTGFQNLDGAYTFMLDKVGRYVYHPLLPLSLNKDDPAVYADFTVLERSESALEVRDGMLRGTRGSVNVFTQYVIPRGTSQISGVDHVIKTLRYTWGQINPTDFSVCVVLDEMETHTNFSTPATFPDRVLFQTTHLTENPPPKCNNFNRVAFKDNVTVTFNEKAFTLPGAYYNLEGVSAERARDIEQYLETGTPRYWTIKPNVRNAVGVLYDKLTSIWAARAGTAEYTMSRYIGLRDGVFIQIPGQRNPKYYDHTKRSWYVKSKHTRGRFALVGPYKDASSGDMVVTLGKTITYNGSEILGVAAMDFSLTHLYYHLSVAYPKCETEVCMIVDENGMVILHADFIQNPPDDPDKLVDIPLVMKEPNIAMELIDRMIITRGKCFNSKSINNQRFMKVALPAGSNVTGDFYEMHSIPETNIFVVIKESRFLGFGKCFCGVNRDETGTPKCTLNTCECPCHTPAEYDYCENRLPENIPVALPCYPDAPSDPYEDLVEIEKEEVSRLEPCYRFNCPAKKSKLSCEGVFSCSWCDEECKASTDCAPPVTLRPTGVSLEPVKEKLPPVGVIIGAAAAGVALIAVLIAVFIYRRWRHTRRTPASPGGYSSVIPSSAKGNTADYNSSTDTASTNIEPFYQVDETRGKVSTLPGLGAAGGSPVNGRREAYTLPPGLSPAAGPPTILPTAPPEPYALDPYPFRALPSLPRGTKVKDFYNNPQDLQSEVTTPEGAVVESPPSEAAPPVAPSTVNPEMDGFKPEDVVRTPEVDGKCVEVDSAVASSRQIIAELEQEVGNTHQVSPPNSDNATCDSTASAGSDVPEIAVTSSKYTGVKNKSLTSSSSRDIEPPYKNVNTRSPSTQSEYTVPLHLQQHAPAHAKTPIAHLSAEDHPKPPPYPPTDADESDILDLSLGETESNTGRSDYGDDDKTSPLALPPNSPHDSIPPNSPPDIPTNSPPEVPPNSPPEIPPKSPGSSLPQNPPIYPPTPGTTPSPPTIPPRAFTDPGLTSPLYVNEKRKSLTLRPVSFTPSEEEDKPVIFENV